MKLTNQIKEAVNRGQSGAITVHSLSAKGECSVTQQDFKAFCVLFELDTQDFNLKHNCIEPITQKGWHYLDELNESLKTLTFEPENEWSKTGYKLKVNHQSVAFAINRLSPESLALLGVSYDYKDIAKEQTKNEVERKLAGYGTFRMGGWVER